MLAAPRLQCGTEPFEALAGALVVALFNPLGVLAMSGAIAFFMTANALIYMLAVRPALQHEH